MAKKTNLKSSPNNKMSLIFKKIRFKHLILFAIILISAILKFHRAQQLFFWNVDEDILGLTIKKILVSHDIQLIGNPIPGGLFIGPAFYYLASFPYLIARMNPETLPVFSALIGIFTTFLVYKIGKIIFEKELIGIFGATIYGFSFLVNAYNRLLTSLTLTPILVLLTYLILYQNLKLKRPKNLLWLGLILIIATQNEGSSFSLLALTIVIWFVYRFKTPISKLTNILLMFILFNLPLLIFDLKHNFFLTKSNLHFFLKGLNPLKAEGLDFSPLDLQLLSSILNFLPRTLSRFLFISGQNDINNQILPCPDLIASRISQIPPAAFILAIIVIGFFFLRQIVEKKVTFGERIILVHIITIILGIFFYNLFLPGYLFEWILVILFPAFALITAYFLNVLYRQKTFGKLLAYSIILVFLLYNIRSLIMASGHFGLSSKVNSVKFALSEVKGRPFYLESLGSCYSQGYLYLFWYYGQSPSHTIGIGTNFAQTLVPSPEGPKPNLGVVLVNPSETETQEFKNKYNLYKTKTVKSKKIKDIEVLIVEEN